MRHTRIAVIATVLVSSTCGGAAPADEGILARWNPLRLFRESATKTTRELRPAVPEVGQRRFSEDPAPRPRVRGDIRATIERLTETPYPGHTVIPWAGATRQHKIPEVRQIPSQTIADQRLQTIEAEMAARGLPQGRLVHRDHDTAEKRVSAATPRDSSPRVDPVTTEIVERSLTADRHNAPNPKEIPDVGRERAPEVPESRPPLIANIRETIERLTETPYPGHTVIPWAETTRRGEIDEVREMPSKTSAEQRLQTIEAEIEVRSLPRDTIVQRAHEIAEARSLTVDAGDRRLSRVDPLAPGSAGIVSRTADPQTHSSHNSELPDKALQHVGAIERISIPEVRDPGHTESHNTRSEQIFDPRLTDREIRDRIERLTETPYPGHTVIPWGGAARQPGNSRQR